jgi:hypothetical protein
MNEVAPQVPVLIEGMLNSICAFEEGVLRIDRLAWELKSRIAGLHQFADGVWADDLKEIWNQLEMINAFYIESGREALNSEERQNVTQVIDELRAALISY